MNIRSASIRILISVTVSGMVGCGSRESNVDAVGTRAPGAAIGREVARRAIPRPRPLPATDTIGNAPAASGTAIPTRYRAFAAAFDAETQSFGAPGAAVAILEHGEITFTHAYGVKGPNSHAPVDADTLFRIGTLTEPLTTAAFLSLADHGRASPDEPVASAVPNVALRGADASRLTMRDLLSSKSGLFDFQTWSQNPDVATLSCAATPGTLHDFVVGSVFGANEFFQAPPDSAWALSNSDFVLTGAAIERASGTPYESAMASTLFRPLGMTRTFFDPAAVRADGDYSNGLSTNPDGSPWDVTPSSYDCGWGRPAEYAFSSVVDYAKYIQFLYAGNPLVLSARTREALQSTQATPYLFGDIDFWGYGVEVKTGALLPAGSGYTYYPTKTLIDGVAIPSGIGMPGYSGMFYFLPETGFGIVMLANTDGAAYTASPALAMRSFGDLPAAQPLPPGSAVDPSAFPLYAGTYLDPSGYLGEMIVADDAGTLTIDLPQLDAAGVSYEAALEPNSNKNFVLTTSGSLGVARLIFVPDSTGRYAWIDIDDGLLASRVEPAGGVAQ